MAKTSSNHDNETTSETLLNIAQAFYFAIDKGFMTQDHAKSVWKAMLRVGGYTEENKEVGR